MDAESIKTLRAEATATAEGVHKLLEGDGARMRSQHTPEAIDAMAEILAQASEGNTRARYALNEAMVTGDFPYLMGDIIDRSTMAAYREKVPNWQAFVAEGTNRDFRASKRFGIEGMQSILSSVQEMAEYPERGITEETPKTFTVAKYGARFGISWESLINDDLGLLRDLPSRLAVAARRTEALAVANAYCSSTGFDTGIFSSGNKNIATTALGMTTPNAPLSIQAIGEALMVMNNQVDADGFPIIIEGTTLVVPPALELTARTILNATSVNIQGMQGAYNVLASNLQTAGLDLVASNWMNGSLQLVVDPYIKLVVTSGTIMNTCWFLFASKSAGRTALEMTYLEGHTTPELFMKTPNAARVGGGTVPESFENDSTEYKIRSVFGVNTFEPKMAFASNGNGS
jgi:hypothetical protein